MAKLKAVPQSWGTRYVFYCEGCGYSHLFDVRTDGGRPSWVFDGDMESPTFSPSLFYPDRVCHLFLRAGRVEYLPDCTHHLAGRTVPLTDKED